MSTSPIWVKRGSICVFKAVVIEKQKSKLENTRIFYTQRRVHNLLKNCFDVSWTDKEGIILRLEFIEEDGGNQDHIKVSMH